MRRLAGALVALLAVFMVATVVVAIAQDDMGWGWWWAVPVGGGFLAAVLGFRILVQRAQDAADRDDADE